MRSSIYTLAAFLLSVAGGAPAHANEHASAPPPRGAIEYCARVEAACALSETTSSAQSQHEAAGQGGRAAPSVDDRRGDWFRLMLRQSRTPGEREVVTLTDAQWSELREVHRQINSAVVEATDEQIYGKSEVWATPLEARPAGSNDPVYGDCEDYALEKRLELVRRGWPVGALSIATANAPFRGLHVVLIVRTDRGDIVLDNTRAEPEAFEVVRYQWLAFQTGEDLLTWWSFDAPDADAATDADRQ